MFKSNRLAEKEERDQDEGKGHGLSGWFKAKVLGKEKEKSPVDTQFLEDLSDLRRVGRYKIVGKLGQGKFLEREPYGLAFEGSSK